MPDWVFSTLNTRQLSLPGFFGNNGELEVYTPAFAFPVSEPGRLGTLRTAQLPRLVSRVVLRRRRVVTLRLYSRPTRGFSLRRDVLISPVRHGAKCARMPPILHLALTVIRRQTQGMTDHQLTAIQISGSDRIEFLQGQFTQDLSLLSPQKPLAAGWASPKGRLYFVSWLADWQDSVWLVVPGELAGPIAKRLGMFVLRADAQVAISDQPVYMLVDKESASDCISNYKYLRMMQDGLGWQIGGEADSVSPEAWRLAHIRAGRPLVWPETSEDFVPQMVNLDLLGGISFTKGCYVGQEIVARTQNLGRIKRRMYRFSAGNGPAPAPGDVIKCEDRGAGKIVDAAPANGDGIELLAVIRIESLNDPLSLDDGRPLTQAPLPYDVPESVDG